jgi:(1->4)-alpha-D-glucan 1-alpha-D-glucosylmutase
VKTREDGRVKMFLIREALALRARRRAVFERGDYRPLEVHGAWAEHVCAFARVGEGGAALTVIPRLLARRGPDTLPHGPGYWADTWLELPADLAGRYTNVLTGESLQTTTAGAVGLTLGAVLAAFPVALLDHHAP